MARFRDLFKKFSEMHAASAGLAPLEGLAKNAPVAQLDRALDYESRGQEFESLRARHKAFQLRRFFVTAVRRRSANNNDGLATADGTKHPAERREHAAAHDNERAVLRQPMVTGRRNTRGYCALRPL